MPRHETHPLFYSINARDVYFTVSVGVIVGIVNVRDLEFMLLDTAVPCQIAASMPTDHGHETIPSAYSLREILAAGYYQPPVLIKCDENPAAFRVANRLHPVGIFLERPIKPIILICEKHNDS